MIVPQAEPVQPVPAIVQLTAGFAVLPTVAVNVLVALTSSVAVAGESATVIAASTATAAAADLVGSAWLVAVTVTDAGDGTAAGAVYRPALVIVPQAAPVQPAPESVQLTAVLLVPPTDAVNNWARVMFTLAAAGATPIVTGVMVTVAAPDLLGSSCEVAVTVTVLGEGAEVGAV